MECNSKKFHRWGHSRFFDNARKPQLYLFCLLLQHFFHPDNHNYGENLSTEARLT